MQAARATIPEVHGCEGILHEFDRIRKAARQEALRRYLCLRKWPIAPELDRPTGRVVLA